MTIIDDFLSMQKKYTIKYGKKTIVIMEIGSFYEMYGIREDGILKDISQLLNIVLTKRDKKKKEINVKNPLLVGFTSVSISKYLRVLLNHNYTVVRVDQTTSPPNPKREVTRIYSPSTSIEEYSIKDTNYILCLYIETNNDKMAIGMTLIDLTTGKSIVYEAYDSLNPKEKHTALQEAYRFIYTFYPKEIIIYSEKCNMTKEDLINYLELDNIIHYFYSEYNHIFNKISYQNEFLLKIFKNCGIISPIQYLDFEKYEFIRVSFILLLQFVYEHDTNIVNYINKPVIYEKQSHLILSNNSIQQLNIIQYNHIESDNKFNCLFDIVNNCSTAIGKRFLKEQLLNPILNKDELEKRYNQIEELRIGDLYKQFIYHLKSLCDIERVQRKLILGLLNPFEFYVLHTSYLNIVEIFKLCNKTNYLKYDIDTIDDYISYYKSQFNLDEMYKYSLKDIHGTFFNKGLYIEIDNLQDTLDSELNILSDLCVYLSNIIDTSINFVKLDKTDKEGYYLNITNKRYELLIKKLKESNISEVKIGDIVFSIDSFKIKKLNTNLKITSLEINKLSSKIVQHKEDMRLIMKDKYLLICTTIYNKYNNLMIDISNMVGEVDMFISNTKTSILYNYTKPIIKNSDKSFIKAQALRHPITEQLCSKIEYVPNDIVLGIENDLDKEDKTDDKVPSTNIIDGMIITGLNGVGKSVLIKMTAISIIMAQSGMYVPASKYIYSPYTHIFSRIGNADNILKGQSTFVKEMLELSTILRYSTPKTLIIADELCSGSEYMSAQAILATTIIRLASIKCNFLFTTHLHGIIEILKKKKIDNIDYYYLDVNYDKEKDNLVYNRTLKKGCSNKLYGIEVSKFIIDDNDFVKMAMGIRNEMLNQSTYIINPKPSTYNTDIFVDKCEICNKQGSDLDVHHIKFQCTADKNNFVDHRHKNNKSNLVVLCKEHHNSVHNNEIIINGWKINTKDGYYLDYEKKEHKPNKRLKYSQDQMDIVNRVKNEFINAKQAKSILLTKYDLKISEVIIRKIWKGEYM